MEPTSEDKHCHGRFLPAGQMDKWGSRHGVCSLSAHNEISGLSHMRLFKTKDRLAIRKRSMRCDVSKDFEASFSGTQDFFRMGTAFPPRRDVHVSQHSSLLLMLYSEQRLVPASH